MSILLGDIRRVFVLFPDIPGILHTGERMLLKMTRTTACALALFSWPTCGLAQGTYRFAPSPESRLELVVTKTGFLRGKQHLFVFDRFNGRLRYDPAKVETSQVQFEIDSKSIVCKDTWVSTNDLRKIQDVAIKDMLDAEHHSRLTFSSMEVRQTGMGVFEARGSLTIRGVTKRVVVMTSVSPGANGALIIEGRAPVRLTDYGLKPPSAAFGTIGTKNEMMLSFHLVATLE
jgi:polyisoprenoid-binding protein YceI